MSNSNQRKALKILKKSLQALGIEAIGLPKNRGKELKYCYRHIHSGIEITHHKSRNSKLTPEQLAKSDEAQIRKLFLDKGVYI